jgi:hypothetical protein
MLEVMQRLTSKRITAQEALIPIQNQSQFWHCSILDEQSFPISGGFGSTRDHARKIAISEFLERMNYHRFYRNTEQHKDWGLDLISTACGFAVGFHKENTILRSIAEAHERWVMSKWIDGDYLIEEIPAEAINSSLDPISKFFASHFDKVLYFKKDLAIQLEEKWIKLEVGQTMGLKDNGIYPGSSAQKTGGNLWQHSLLESFRHYLAVKNNPDRGDTFPDNKVHFFSKNAHIALEQIYKPKKIPWPISQIKFHRCEHIEDGDYFLARTIVDGWRTWNQGPLERFLY